MKYNIWNKWDKLRTVMIGDCYGSEFYQGIKNDKIRNGLQCIADESVEDLDNYSSVLKEFGCEVLRPTVDRTDRLLNYVEDGRLGGNPLHQRPIPKAPLEPRNRQLVMGNDLVYTPAFNHQNIPKIEHPGIKEVLDQYSPDYIDLSVNSNAHVDYRLETDAPNITVVGKDVYLDASVLKHSNIKEIKGDEFRFNTVNLDGHHDGNFHTLKPGVIFSLFETQRYEQTFPGWDVLYLEEQGVKAFSGQEAIKRKNYGKWWIPGEEENLELENFIDKWLNDWMGYVAETVFDVNVLVLDEHHVCVSQMNNPEVNAFLKKHKMEPVYIPWRHRFFWDGGLHCISLDLYREGTQQDYFPLRKEMVVDKGYE